jgi:hypothetical protein
MEYTSMHAILVDNNIHPCRPVRQRVPRTNFRIPPDLFASNPGTSHLALPVKHAQIGVIPLNQPPFVLRDGPAEKGGGVEGRGEDGFGEGDGGEPG